MKLPIGLIVLASMLCISAVHAAFNVTAVQLSKDTGYGITNVIQTPDRAYPGDQVSISFSLSTTKSAATDVILTPSIPFLSTTNTFSLNALPPNQPKTLTLTMDIPNTTKAGTYPLFFYVQDKETPQIQLAQIQFVVNQQNNPNALIAKISFANMTTGSSGTVNVDITNPGTLDTQNVIIQLQTGNSTTFTALETDRKYVAAIPAQRTVTVPFTIGVSAGAPPGYYPLNIAIQYTQDQLSQTPISQQLGVQVNSKAELLLTADQSTNADGSNAVTLTLANVGDTAVRGVFVSASSQTYRIQGSPDKFIGTLNLDDSSTVSYTVNPRGQSTITGTMDVSVSYKDPSNQEHTLIQTIDLTPGNIGGGTLGTNSRFRRQSAGLFGIDLAGWALIALVLIVGGFFGFRWYKKRKAAKPNSPGGGKK